MFGEGMSVAMISVVVGTSALGERSYSVVRLSAELARG